MNEWSDQNTNAYPAPAPPPVPQAGAGYAYPPTVVQPAPTPPPSRRPRRRWAAVAVVAALMLAAILVGVAIGNVVWGADTQLTAQSQPIPVNDSTGTNDVPSDSGAGSLPYAPSDGYGSPYDDGSSVPSSVLSDVADGLVYINVTIGSKGAQGAGTGIVLTSDGKVLTNNHIVNGATDISVSTLADGQTYDAEVLGYDRTEDVALIQLENASDLETAPIGSSSSVTVGDAIVTMGNAGGDGGEPSVSEGSVTALDQTITASDQDGGNAEQLDGLIENDANVQPGDSGGAVVDDSGEVIGMNTAGSSANAYGQTAPESYAVPIDTALAIADQIDNGQSSDTVHVGPTAFLGVAISSGGATSGSSGSPYGDSSGSPYGDSYGSPYGDSYGSPYGDSSGSPYGDSGSSPYGSPYGQQAGSSGASVSGVQPGSPAEQAGIVAGDTIVAIDDTGVDSADSLVLALGTHHPGDTVSVTWVDQSGSQHSADVTLAEGPAA